MFEGLFLLDISSANRYDNAIELNNCCMAAELLGGFSVENCDIRVARDKLSFFENGNCFYEIKTIPSFFDNLSIEQKEEFLREVILAYKSGKDE